MSKPFPWRPGMRTTRPVQPDYISFVATDDGVERIWSHRYGWRLAADVKPAQQDGATLGALRQVIRELRGDPSWSPTPLAHDPGVVEWVIDPPSRERQTLYPSEFAAMMAAFARIT